jgi:ABC-type nitrate/sulfonate/bicarbonate transport system substrate-binding protein
LLEQYPANISSFEGGLVVTAGYLAANRNVVEKVVLSLAEALAFCLSETNGSTVMDAFKSSLGINDKRVADQNLRSLKKKPYASIPALRKMQAVMAIHDPRVLDLKIEDLINDVIVRSLDESGALDRPFSVHGVK